jgi:hypothetical protein
MTFYLFVAISRLRQFVPYTVGLFTTDQLHRATIDVFADRPFSHAGSAVSWRFVGVLILAFEMECHMTPHLWVSAL